MKNAATKADSKILLEMKAFRREVSTGMPPEKLLKTLLLETIAAMDASGGGTLFIG